VGKSVLELRDVRQSATYTCNAQSDLGNIAADADVIVKGSYTAHIHSSSASTLYTFHHLATQIPSLLLLLLLLLLLHQFNDLFSRTTWVSRYQKGKTSLDLNDTRDDGVLGWQWHQLDHMQTICTSLQTDNQTTPTPHHSVVYRSDALPVAQATALAWHAIVLTM